MSTERPTYWSVTADELSTWVNLLGVAAAGKLMAALAAYFFDGTEPDEFKLTKQARVVFEGERKGLDRRRASAINGARRGNKGREDATPANDENLPAADVEKSCSGKKNARKSRRSSEKTSKKSQKNRTAAPAPTCEINNSRLAPILNLNLSHTPLTPRAGDEARGSGGGGDGCVTPDELAALVADGLGYDTPGAYGMRTPAVVSG